MQKYPDRKRYRNAQKWKYFEEFQEVYGDSSAICEGKSILDHVLVNYSKGVRGLAIGKRKENPVAGYIQQGG